MITVLFFAHLREQLGIDRMEMQSSARDVAGVRAELLQQQPQWRGILDADTILCAVNHTVAKPHTPVTEGDEVAFYPPVTGG